MLRPAALVLLICLFALTACDSDNDSGSTSSSSTTGTPAETAGGLDDQYGVRYCEVLALTVGEGGPTGEVWGSQGLNECPQAAFGSLDPAALATELGATLAVLNGPRYWVLDDIVANEVAGSGEIRDLGGIEMRSIATVDLGPDSTDRTPYSEISVARDTEFIFDAEREIHEITAPDGSVYIMQSYSNEVDPDLSLDNLNSLATRLELPDGWTFTTRVLDETLVVEDIDGTATVIQDELRNTYQLRTRG